MRFSNQKDEIVWWARLLNERGFVTARSGNISRRIAPDKILITAHDTYLGHLEEEDLLLIDSKGAVLEGTKETTSEKRLHLDIHRAFADHEVILHAHPPFTVALFHYFESLDIFSFEAKFYLGNVGVIPQDSPTVTDTKPVVEALKGSQIVVLKDHGVVSVGKDFKEPFSLIELLEEQAKVNLTMRRLPA
ncbi:MAG: class II aldolase/adducin family protein [Thermodesulfobacteriota bacterium]|nr:class II aldolase/adducin family protein [Thermodesulfobacteriota bacterium]